MLTTIDLGMAIIIIIFFVTIMTSIMYNIYISQTEAKRTATALNYAVDVFEYIAEIPYNSVQTETLFSSIDTINISNIETGDNFTTGNINGYNFRLEIEDPYGDDMIKLITLTINYKITAKREESIKLQRIKQLPFDEN